MVGTEGPQIWRDKSKQEGNISEKGYVTSTSSSPTLFPRFVSATASWQATFDLPTPARVLRQPFGRWAAIQLTDDLPPFPDKTKILCFIAFIRRDKASWSGQILK